MKREEVVRILKRLKRLFSSEGFEIIGIVGSFARGEKFNDIDIVYRTTKFFEKKYKGWEYFLQIEKIKKIFEQNIGYKIDLINNDTPNEIVKKYILKDLKSV